MEAEKLSPDNPVTRNELVVCLRESAASMEAMNNIGQAAAQYQMILKYDRNDIPVGVFMVALCLSLICATFKFCDFIQYHACLFN